MEPKPDNSKQEVDALNAIRMKMVRSGDAQSVVLEGEHDLENLKYTISLNSINQHVKGNAQERFSFYQGNLLGLLIARRLLTDQELKQLHDAIRTTENEVNQNTNYPQVVYRRILSRSGTALQNHMELAKELTIVIDMLAEQGNLSEDYALNGFGIMLHIIDLAKEKAIVAEREAIVARAAIQLDAMDKTVGIANFLDGRKDD